MSIIQTLIFHRLIDTSLRSASSLEAPLYFSLPQQRFHRYGSAFEVQTSGTYSITNNTFNGYWSHSGDAADGATFNTTTGIGSNLITTDSPHGFTSGERVFYNNNGGSASIGLTNDNFYHADVVSTTTLYLHNTRFDANRGVTPTRISLTSTGGETHTLYSANAAIINNTGGLTTFNITGGNTPYIRNVGTSTSVVNVSVPITITGATEGSRILVIGNGGAADGQVILEGYADSNGELSGTYGGSTPQNVFIRARNGGIVTDVQSNSSGGGWVDYTNDARDLSGASDVPVWPASTFINDALYIGGINKFSEVEVKVSQATSGNTERWEYWNGSIWATFTISNQLTSTGWLKVNFGQPSNWATTTVNGVGPFYYWRISS